MRTMLAVLLSLGFAVTSFAGIAGSVHDLSDDFAGTDQICIFCHTPHGASESTLITSNPLWNMDVPVSTGYTSYAISVSSTFNGVVTDPLAGPTRLCMSCHDGSIAIDNAINPSSADYIGVVFSGTTALLDKNLSNDHPVGFDYAAAAGLDTEIAGTSTAYGSGSRTIADYLFDGDMTCATCHDVHTPSPSNPAATAGMFLVKGNTASALCLNCHIK